MWEKIKNVYNRHHAQVPVVQSLDDRWRVFHSDRAESKSVPKYFEISKDNFKIILDTDVPIAEHGKRGSFDWAGIMPTALIYPEPKTVFLYYIGWSVRKDVPYHNNLGLLVSKDNGANFIKFSEGPVFSTSYKEPGYIGTISVIFDEGIFKGWYLSCRDWVEDNGKFEPVYDIKYAVSKNGIDWEPAGITCISLEEDEGGLSQASVIKKEDGTYYMWFSSRKKRDFRTNKDNSYRILCASSSDGLNWERNDKSLGLSLSDAGWDSEMVEYPYVIRENKDFYMFYNGNSFGKSGIGLAKWNRTITPIL